MKAPLLSSMLLATTLVTGAAFADDDCHDPVADWQPKEALRQMLEAEGWKVNRIKVDDGCYEVKGFDQDGNKVKAEYFPASLRLRKLKIKFDEDAVIPDGIPNQNMQDKPNKPNKRDNSDKSNKGERP